MILKHKKTVIYPKDSTNFKDDLGRLITESYRDIYDDLQNLFTKNLESNEKIFNEYHALLVELGKNICKKVPICDKCPINKNCNYDNKAVLKQKSI